MVLVENANIKGVYWWDPCYHIWQHHGSYGKYQLMISNININIRIVSLKRKQNINMFISLQKLMSGDCLGVFQKRNHIRPSAPILGLRNAVAQLLGHRLGIMGIQRWPRQIGVASDHGLGIPSLLKPKNHTYVASTHGFNHPEKSSFLGHHHPRTRKHHFAWWNLMNVSRLRYQKPIWSSIICGWFTLVQEWSFPISCHNRFLHTKQNYLMDPYWDNADQTWTPLKKIKVRWQIISQGDHTWNRAKYKTANQHYPTINDGCGYV